jgi:histidinol-phosphate aminotransferase
MSDPMRPRPSIRNHPLVREAVSSLPVHPLRARYRAGVTERINTCSDLAPYAAYPTPDHSSLKSLYLAHLERTLGREFVEEELVFTRGAIDAIETLFRVFCEPREETVAITPPTFGGYVQAARINGNQVLSFPLEGENFDRLPVERLADCGSKALFLCNPNNPVGSVLSLEQIDEVLSRFAGLVVVDEVYAEFGGKGFTSAVPLIHSYPNLAVIRSFSKAWGLAGVRVGAILGGMELVEAVTRVQDPFYLSTPTQDELHQMLKDSAKFESMVQTATARRDQLVARLSKLPTVRKVYPSHTNFVLAVLDPHAPLVKRLEQAGCLFADMNAAVPQAVRLSPGTPADSEAIIAALS